MYRTRGRLRNADVYRQYGMNTRQNRELWRDRDAFDRFCKVFPFYGRRGLTVDRD